MTASAGSEIRLRIGDGATPTESFTALSGLQITRMQLSQEAVDLDAVRGSGWIERLAAGERSLMLRAQGVYTDCAPEQMLQTAAMTGQAKNMQLAFGNGDVVSGAFIMTSFEREGEVGDIESYALELKSAGAIALS
jgi:TP901-1 family phage major tail protein